MSEPGKAVFLSYASQDTEAAKRICDALRQAGVEVWFDQNELVGGDAWDAKIRKQIKECALFVPIISANTQARAEGYFRLEWKLAVDRSHLMADDQPFLFPVVIDDTPDATARVPDRFRDVQWTRLTVKDTPESLAVRIGKLLGGDNRTESSGGPTARRAPGKSPWIRNLSMILGLTIGLVYAVRPFFQSSRRPEPKAPVIAPPAAPVSEARKLADKAQALFDQVDSTRDDFTAAEGLVQRATALDPSDGLVWAISSRLNSSYRMRGFDVSPARAEAARTQAERALRLAPDASVAWLARGAYLRGSTGEREAAILALRKALELDPADTRPWFDLAMAISTSGHEEEGFALMEKSIDPRRPGSGALARYNQFIVRFSQRRFAEAEALARTAVEELPSVNFVTGLVRSLLTWKGDTAEAITMLERLTAERQNEPRAVFFAAYARLLARQPAEALKTLRRLPADFIEDSYYTGPKGYWDGWAQQMLGNADAARVAWEGALAVSRQQGPGRSGRGTLIQAELFALLDRKDDALRTVSAYEQSMTTDAGTLRNRSWEYSAAKVFAVLGMKDEALIRLDPMLSATAVWPLTPALLRLDPVWDKLRGDPRFQKLCAEPAASSSLPLSPSALPVADSKSVAVLAFANLSDDKANEYFSDGISEELLNVLAKVPGLKVSARTSAFYFKGKDTPISEIARQLGVAYVVEGSVRKAGDKVRITAQLIKAADGFHVWSDTFTRELKDVFAVQDEISSLIAQNLQLKLAGGSERSALDPRVYEVLLQARAAARQESNDGRRQAVILYQQAVAMEPRLSMAWAEMAQAYVGLGRFGGLPIAGALQEARQAAQRALELDAAQPLGLVALGWVQRTADWDWRAAQRSFGRAVELAPASPVIVGDAAVCYFNVGREEEALALARRAVDLDPLSARAHLNLGFLLNVSGRFEASLGPLTRAVELSPSIDECRAHQSWALCSLGRLREAETILAQEPSEVYRLSAQWFVLIKQGDPVRAARIRDEFIAKYGDEMPGYVAILFAADNETDLAFLWLNRSVARRDAAAPWIKNNSYLRRLHSDPRWPVLLHKIGLTDDQLK